MVVGNIYDDGVNITQSDATLQLEDYSLTAPIDKFWDSIILDKQNDQIVI
jgi:hypothetical protein